MNYSKSSLPISQQPLFRDTILSNDQLDNMPEKVVHWPKVKIAVLNGLLLWATTYDKVGVSQGKLALIAGTTRQTVNKYIKELTDEGYVSKKFRNRMTCLYVVHPNFFNPSVRISLRHIFSALKHIPPLLLSICHHALNFFKNTYKRTILTVVIYGDNRKKNKYSAGRARRSFVDGLSRAMGGTKVISNEIETIDFLGKLTKDQKMRLSVFPDEAIIHNKVLARYAPEKKDAFAWFYSLCVSYCKANGITPQWSNRYVKISSKIQKTVEEKRPVEQKPDMVKQERPMRSDNSIRRPERSLYVPRERIKITECNIAKHDAAQVGAERIAGKKLPPLREGDFPDEENIYGKQTKFRRP